MAWKSVEILDTTLRDGSQGVGVSFTLRDKLRIVELLDELGVDYIEGGWPGSNPKDEEFFREVKNLKLTKAKIAAFGSTRKRETKVDVDPNLTAIVNADVDVAVIFGKAWTLHVTEVLRATKEENLDMVYDSVEYLRSHGMKVIFDAEHFYQGYFEARDYALKVVTTAQEAGAEVVALADTNGGMLPHQVYEATKDVVSKVKVKIGVHMHNDSGCAVANSIMGVVAGARHIQGTINGIGERTGNADLIQIIPGIALKVGLNLAKGTESLAKLRYVSRTVANILEMQPNPYQPYVGENAFSHKAGVHADAVMKNPRAYEHIDPSLVGNRRNIVISELSGSANLLNYARDVIKLDLDKRDERLKKVLAEVKEREKEGYSFDVAPMSAILILMRGLGMYRELIKLDYWKVISEPSMSIAVVKANSNLEVAEGVGPVEAVDKALRKALRRDFPSLDKVTLTDYRVILPGEIKNTESVVRVTIEFSDGKEKWRTMGVSANVIEASVKALVDGFDYYLQRN